MLAQNTPISLHELAFQWFWFDVSVSALYLPKIKKKNWKPSIQNTCRAHVDGVSKVLGSEIQDSSD